MNKSFKVIRSVIKNNGEFGARIIAEFDDKADAFYWCKYQDNVKNKHGKCRYYLQTLKDIYYAKELPATYKLFDLKETE